MGLRLGHIGRSVFGSRRSMSRREPTTSGLETTRFGRANPYGFTMATALLLILCSFAAPFALAKNDDPITGEWGGGPPPTPAENCLTPAQLLMIEEQSVRNSARLGLRLEGGPGGTASYTFQPIAGNVWQDRFIHNFVDLDSSSPGPAAAVIARVHTCISSRGSTVWFTSPTTAPASRIRRANGRTRRRSAATCIWVCSPCTERTRWRRHFRRIRHDRAHLCATEHTSPSAA